MTEEELIRRELYEELHALIRPLSALKDCRYEGELPASDGSRILRPEDRPLTLPEFLHQVIHCCFCHIYLPLPKTAGISWDLCLDISAWEIARRWLPERFPEELRAPFLSLSFLVPPELLYQPEKLRAYIKEPKRFVSLTEKELLELSGVLSQIERLLPEDDHSLWPSKNPPGMRNRVPSSGDGAGTGRGMDPSETRRSWEYLRRTLTARNQPLSPEIMDPKLRKRMSGSLQKKTRAPVRVSLTDRKRFNYRDLLKELSSWREETRTNSSEFHYASYLYGLEALDGVPLIEPLEQEETKKLGDLVIVIDTSASCSGDLVQAFLEETRNLILENDLFFHPFELHILQCDTDVRRDERITSVTELEEYVEDLEVHGRGGTDFCPAFTYIETLKQEGVFSELQGILFFTDGLGKFPTAPPEERTIFVFLKDRYDDIDLPDWAETLILDD